MRNKSIVIVMLVFVLTIWLLMPSILTPLSALASENQYSNAYDAVGADKSLQACADNASSSAGNWNFSDASEWSKHVYKDGNKTRIIVGLSGQQSSTLLQLRSISTKHGGQVVNTVSMKGIVKAAVVELLLASVTAFAEDVRSLGVARYVEPNMKVQVQFTPNDPFWNAQWGPKKVEVDWAWNTTTGNSTVLVAVVDTGIDYSHPDLMANYAALGYDWVNMDSIPLDDHGHGTHVAGTIAAVLNNNVGVAGMAQVSIMAEKVLNAFGEGTYDSVANGIIHATDQGAKIISMSLGGPSDSELLHEAVKYAYDAGVLVVAAAGNSNSNVKSYPAAYEEVVAIAATDEYDYKAPFSNWGDWIELAAPGVDVYSTMPTYWVTLNVYGYPMDYAYLSGTSMACPHVSGLAALVWSQYPTKTRDWVRLWLRFTADDLGDPGFDVYYGFGRINARKSVEQGVLMHELVACEWATPPYVPPGNLGSINVTVLNFGENDERDVTVQLLVNDTMVDSEVVAFLAGGTSATVHLLWNPTEEGRYNVTAYVEFVPGEANLQNNILSKRLYVGTPVRALVLHSAGNIIGEIIANWQELNDEWDMFGDTMIYIDYTTLDKQDITYEDLASSGADVLIISCAYDPFLGWQFTNTEIDAITRYVHEGHGLIVTAGTFYEGVPNNNKLARLLGMNNEKVWTATYTDLLHLQNLTHPLLKNIPDPLVFPLVGTAVSTDGRWDQNELVGGKYVGLGHYSESAVVEYKGLVYISPWLEVIPAYYHHHLQLLYNAITWSRYQRPQHELAAFVQAPRWLKPGQSIQLNATVSNSGLNNENNVEMNLLINDAIVDSIAILELPSDESLTLQYYWSPIGEGIYNITAYVVPVSGEDDVGDNVASAKTFVSSVSVALLQNFDPWNAKSNEEVLDSYGIPWVVYGSNDFGSFDINAYAKVVIASDQDQTFYVAVDAYRSWFEDYVRNGGILEIHAAERGWHGGTWVGPLPGNLHLISSYRQYVIIADPTHPILNVPNKITAEELNNWNFAVHGFFSSYPEEARIIVIEASSGMPAYLELPFGAGEILATSQPLEWAYLQEFSLILENSLLYMPARQEHDISITLQAPYYLGLNDSRIINATVANRGLNNETAVELRLLINDTVVYTEIVGELSIGSVYAVHYPWTPVSTGIYNMTAYAQPVPGETILQNNLAARMVAVFFYSELYAPHRWVGSGNAMEWHGDDSSFPYNLPFEFPFYEFKYTTIYVSTNGLITFAGPDSSFSNSVPALAGKLAIAVAWQDWTTDAPYDIYIWQNSTHVGIKWHVAPSFDRTITANFEAILGADGIIQLNYGSCDANVMATAGISNGINHIIAENIPNLNYVDTIFFLPYQILRDIAVTSVSPFVNEVTAGDMLNVTVAAENKGDYAESFNLTAYAVLQPIPLATAPMAGLDSTRIYLDPSDYIFDTDHVSVGYRFNVTVRVDNVDRLAMWQVGIYYDGNLLSATRWFEPTWDPDYVFYNEVTLSVSDFDYGVVLTGAALVPPVQNVFNGSGELCVIEFEVVTSPPEGTVHSCPLNIDNTDTFLLDRDNVDILATKENGYYEISSPLFSGTYVIGTAAVNLGPRDSTTVTIVWNTTDVIAGDYEIYAVAPCLPSEIDMEDNIFHDGIVTVNPGVSIIHDVALLMLNVSSDVIYQGWTVSLSATVANLGNASETFSVAFYCDDYVLGTLVIEDLEPNATLTVSFSWDTISVPRYHNYTLKAVANPMPGEVDTVNNELLYGQVNVRIMGDINTDGIVNMKDIQTVCSYYGTYPGHDGWASEADLDQNGRVDLRDIGIGCRNFMQTA